MTVGDLKEILGNYPDKTEVFIDYDTEWIKEYELEGKTETTDVMAHTSADLKTYIVIY